MKKEAELKRKQDILKDKIMHRLLCIWVNKLVLK